MSELTHPLEKTIWKSKKLLGQNFDYNHKNFKSLARKFSIQHTKKNRSRKNVDKDGKTLYKLMDNAGYGKTL